MLRGGWLSRAKRAGAHEARAQPLRGDAQRHDARKRADELRPLQSARHRVGAAHARVTHMSSKKSLERFEPDMAAEAPPEGLAGASSAFRPT